MSKEQITNQERKELDIFLAGVVPNTPRVLDHHARNSCDEAIKAVINNPYTSNATLVYLCNSKDNIIRDNAVQVSNARNTELYDNVIEDKTKPKKKLTNLGKLFALRKECMDKVTNGIAMLQELGVVELKLEDNVSFYHSYSEELMNIEEPVFDFKTGYVSGVCVVTGNELEESFFTGSFISYSICDITDCLEIRLAEECSKINNKTKGG